jgi:dihydroorotase
MYEVEEVVLSDILAGHVHLREGPLLDTTIPINSPHSCVVHIPNLKDSVDSGARLEVHQKEIMSHKPDFQIIWGIMLTKRTAKEGIRHARDLGACFLKYIPADTSAYTGSDIGITLDELPEYYPLLDYGFSLDIAFLIHAERIRTKKGAEIPFQYREEEAIPGVDDLTRNFPGRKMRSEHVSTKNMIEFLRGKKVKKAFTPQHIRKTFSQVFDAMGNVIQENFCMPILKPLKDLLAVRKEMVFGDYDMNRYGPDDAIHTWHKKLEGMPGVFVPPSIALSITCEEFEKFGQLPRLPEFFRFRQEDEKFFGVKLKPEYRKRVILEKKSWIVPEVIRDKFVPFLRREKLNWRIKEVINL